MKIFSLIATIVATLLYSGGDKKLLYEVKVLTAKKIKQGLSSPKYYRGRATLFDRYQKVS